MNQLVIDISRDTVRQNFDHFGMLGGLRLVLWFRIARPLGVVAMWLLLSLYVYRYLIVPGTGEFPAGQLAHYAQIVGGMAGLLIVWMVLYRMGRRWMGKRHTAHAPVQIKPLPHWPDATALAHTGMRVMVAHHDRAGLIAGITAFPEPVEHSALRIAAA